MGSSKKEKSSKKKKHRSRSRSPSEEPERKHKKHKKDKDREKDKDKEKSKKSKEEKESSKQEKKLAPPSIDVEDGEYPSDGEIAPPPPEKQPPSSGESLSIEETNKLRAKLGLKPLEVGETKKEEKKDVHKPAENLREKKEAEKLREKLKERQQKRVVEGKFKGVKGLADSDDEDVQSWVQKLRIKQKEKEEAEKRAKMLEELEDEFGVGELVEENFRQERSSAYSAKNLRGLKVEHDVEKIAEDREIILTLKDQNVLDEENGDTLVNVNLVDSERYEKNNELRKKKPGYNAYEDEEIDEFGMPKKKSLLSHYDAEIDGEKKKAFVIGNEDGTPEERNRRAAEAIRARLSMASKKIESLQMPAPQVASNYYTPEEMVAFKKPKKKVRKVRKNGVLTADDLLALKQEDEGSSKDLGSRNQEKLSGDVEEDHAIIDDTAAPPEELFGAKIEEPDELKSVLESSLNKARRLKRNEAHKQTLKQVASTLLERQVKQEVEEDEAEVQGMVLHSTSEFCRTLGDLPTLGLSIKEEEMDEMDVEEEKEEYVRRGWAEVNADDEPMAVDEENPSTSRQATVILDEEPVVAVGVGAALKFAKTKGYIEQNSGKKTTMSAALRSMQAKNYTIEDKNFEDDKYSRRERYAGPVMDFKDKPGYKPNVKLEYIDDSGHMLDQKEAFRYLSHKFHGKGSGKMKSEKREKKMQEKMLLTEPSLGDKPFDTLHKLQEKQKELHSPYIVLTGSKANATSLVKSKPEPPAKKTKK